MILNKKDLKFYLSMDMKSYGRKSVMPRLFYDDTWKFQLALRIHEYHANQHGMYHKLLSKVWGVVHSHYGIKMGWSIPINTFGPGLKINHYGLIVVNDLARIGAFCDIHQGVNIGQNGKECSDVPIVGDNVWIGPGAKIFGKIKIADGCAIGANAVVNKSFEENFTTIAGVPARKVNNIGNIWPLGLMFNEKKEE